MQDTQATQPQQAFARPLLIGVSSRLYHPGSMGPLKGVFTRTLHYLEQSVGNWVLAGNAIPVVIPVLTQQSLAEHSQIKLQDYTQALDGLLLQGGADMAPQSYGETPLRPEWAGDAVRDRYEMELISAFMAAGKPVLGVCRGLQVINVMHGGSLWQDLPSQRPGTGEHRELEKYEHHYHEVALEPGSRLAALYPGVNSAMTNSIHHQGIKNLAPGFVVEARCVADGCIEAIRKLGEPFVAAVQWHPEFHERGGSKTFDDSAYLDDFLSACRQAQGQARA